MHPSGLHVSTPTDTTIVLTRVFQAPRKLVWEAMFTPARMQRWMLPPPGWTLMTCVCEARVGGALKLVWKGEDGKTAMTLQGVFTEVIVHEKATHTEDMLLGDGQKIGSLVETHEFAEQGGVTLMKITQKYASKEARDGAVNSGMEEGMEAGYRSLDAELAEGW